MDHHHHRLSVFFTVSLILLFFTLLNSTAYALTYSVGGKHGSWVPNPPESYSSWAKRSRFRTGDSLLFKYKKGEDSVLVVEKNDYYTCNSSNPLKKLDGGNSVFTFDRSGPFFFISGQPGHCEKDEKFIVIVMSSSTGGVSPVSPPTVSPVHHPIPSPHTAPSPHATPPGVPSPQTAPSPSSHDVSPPAYAPVPSSHVVAPTHAPSAYAQEPSSHSPSHAAPVYAPVPSSQFVAPVYPPAAYAPEPSGYAPSKSPVVEPPTTTLTPSTAPVVQPSPPRAATPTCTPQPAAYAPGPGPAADEVPAEGPTTPLVPAEAPPKKNASPKSDMTPILVVSSAVLVLLLNVGFGMVV